jgi:hypothetical protein
MEAPGKQGHRPNQEHLRQQTVQEIIARIHAERFTKDGFTMNRKESLEGNKNRKENEEPDAYPQDFHYEAVKGSHTSSKAILTRKG